jgi:hypothetical protein
LSPCLGTTNTCSVFRLENLGWARLTTSRRLHEPRTSSP